MRCYTSLKFLSSLQYLWYLIIKIGFVYYSYVNLPANVCIIFTIHWLLRLLFLSEFAIIMNNALCAYCCTITLRHVIAVMSVHHIITQIQLHLGHISHSFALALLQQSDNRQIIVLLYIDCEGFFFLFIQQTAAIITIMITVMYLLQQWITITVASQMALLKTIHCLPLQFPFQSLFNCKT